MTDYNDIKKTLGRLRKLMYGFNYQVTIDLNVFDNCTTVEVFHKLLADKYKKANPAAFQPRVVDKGDFWKEVNFGLMFRGDRSSGLRLTSSKEEELLREQQVLKDFISQFISEETQIYSYPEDLGVPSYIVDWGFIYLLLNKDKAALLFYASASD